VLEGLRLGAAALLAAVALASCGGEEAEGPAPPPDPAGEPAAPGPESSASDEAPPSMPEEGADRDPASGGAAGADGTGASGACVFTAPEGRLAEAEVAIELDGVPCEEALPLARAAALGQPAGANLEIARSGFECEPSTATKGANVIYTCTGASGSAAFDVVWSERAG
jgi:hypothetical protein